MPDNGRQLTLSAMPQKLENDLSAGQYDCVATDATSSTANVTIDAVPEVAPFGSHIVDTESGD